MTGNTYPSIKKEFCHNTIDLSDMAIDARLEAVKTYRCNAAPYLAEESITVRISDMLHSALYHDWAWDTFEACWLSIEELSWGTMLPKLVVAEALLDIAFAAKPVISCRRIDGVTRFALGEGMRDQL